MNVRIETPYAKVNVDMSAAGASNLIMQAFEYATKDDSKLEYTATTEQDLEDERYLDPDEAHNLYVQATEPLPHINNRISREQYKGFLLIKCTCCGKVKGFNTKEPLSHYQCSNCGGFTELNDLKMAYLDCKCGARWKYRTNITDEQFDYSCLNCNNTISARLNSRRNTYVTIM